MTQIRREEGDRLIKWPGSSFRKPKNIRCPYCVEGDDFKLMVVQTGGDWFLCTDCGHLAIPSQSSFQCLCGKCVGVGKASSKRFIKQ